MQIIVSSRIRSQPGVQSRRLSGDQVRNIFRRSSVYFINEDGGIVEGRIIDWRPETHGPRVGQLGAVVVKADDQSRWFWGVDPITHEVLLIQRLALARRVHVH